MAYEKYIGKTFFSYKIVGLNEDKWRETGRTHFDCICLECGEHFPVRIDKVNKIYNVVGCKKCSRKLRKEKYPKLKEIHEEDIIGDFIMLKELGYIKKPQTHDIYWLGKCKKCGGIKELNSAHLKAGQNTCRCSNASAGEKKIAKILQENNISFEREYIFSDLSNRRFDFAILDSKRKPLYLIEYDGEQHFLKDKQFHFHSLESQEIRDREKNNYCLKNNYPLIRIPFTKYPYLTLKDLTLDSEYKI